MERMEESKNIVRKISLKTMLSMLAQFLLTMDYIDIIFNVEDNKIFITKHIPIKTKKNNNQEPPSFKELEGIY